MTTLRKGRNDPAPRVRFRRRGGSHRTQGRWGNSIALGALLNVGNGSGTFNFNNAADPAREEIRGTDVLSDLVAPMLSNHHISSMARTHPHAEATYQVISLPNCSFGVEVTIPDTYPTKVSGFATKAVAQAWIAEHKRSVEANTGVNRIRGSYRPFGKRVPRAS